MSTDVYFSVLVFAVVPLVMRWPSRHTVVRLVTRLLAILVTAICLMALLSSCTSMAYNSMQRKVRQIERIVDKYPEFYDSLKFTRTKLVTVMQVKDSLVFTALIDSAEVDRLAMELASLQNQLDHPTTTIGRQRVVIREKLIRATCPEVRKDTVINLLVVSGGDTLKVPVSVALRVVPGTLFVAWAKLNTPTVEWKRKEVHTQLNFNPPARPFYKVPWFWSTALLLLIMVVVLLVTLKK